MGKIIGFGCLGLIVLIIIIAAVSGGSKKETTKQTTDTTQPAQISTPETQKEEVKKEETKTEFGIGETINLKGHQLIVNSVNSNYKSSNQFDKPQSSENNFVVVNVTIVNSGDNDLSANSYGFKLEDETGTQRNSTFVVGVTDELQSVTLSPNGKTSGNLVFEAKKNSSKLILHYSGNILSGGEVTIKLK